MTGRLGYESISKLYSLFNCDPYTIDQIIRERYRRQKSAFVQALMTDIPGDGTDRSFDPFLSQGHNSWQGIQTGGYRAQKPALPGRAHNRSQSARFQPVNSLLGKASEKPLRNRIEPSAGLIKSREDSQDELSTSISIHSASRSSSSRSTRQEPETSSRQV